MVEIARTERLVLRQLEVSDLEDIYRIYHSGDVCRFIEPMSEDRDEEKAKLESYIYYMYGFYGFGLYAVCLKDSGRMIGRCGVWMSEIDGSPEMEIGYMIDANEQRKGYALESVLAVIDFARNETDAERIVAKIHHENDASARLALKAGFVKKGELSSDKNTGVFTYELVRCNKA